MDRLSFGQEMVRASGWSVWGQKKKVTPVNEGKQVYGKCIARIREISAGGGRKDREEKRKEGSIVGRQTVALSWVDMVTRHKFLFYWSENENALFIYRSLIMNPPKAGWEAEVWSVQVKAFLLRIHVTYFISLFDLRVCYKLLVIPKSWDSLNKEHNNCRTTFTS